MTTAIIPDLHTASAQEVYDFIANHLRTQGHQAVSLDKDPNCLYRTENHESCAVGCLIPDDLYDPDIEGSSINCVINPSSCEKATVLFLKLGFQNHFDMLNNLQRIHDSWDNSVKHLEEGLVFVSEKYNLLYTNPTIE